ncbi:MAG: mechanosensitive ion channel family protein [Acidobacteria bacterium]|nr:mechanosensitive ion channel family protein [Acidobacteriota bacterium]MCB9396801.1 mechanosensitive ion channel family protein [Acidobacteriota bacterium]
MFESIRHVWDAASHFDVLVFTLNLLLFIFAKPIAALYPGGKESPSYSTRLWSLRILNGVLFILYFLMAFFVEAAQEISATGLILLLGYLFNHFIQVYIVNRFGRERDLDGEKVLVPTYQSQIFGLLALILLMVLTLLGVINVWGITSLLHATGVVGGLLIIAFSTKDVWAPDNINALIMLYNKNFDSGSVIRVDELGILAIVVKLTLTQTVLRDLRTGHQILVPNAKLRNAKIEVLSQHVGSGLKQFIDYKIGYGVRAEQVEQLFEEAYKRAAEKEAALHAEKKVTIACLETGDHAVTWRVFFSVSNVYRLLKAHFAMNRAAYEVSLEMGIGLNTPTTHQILPSDPTTWEPDSDSNPNGTAGVAPESFSDST